MESYIINRQINFFKCDYGQMFYSHNVTTLPSDIFPVPNQCSILSIFNKINSGKKISINNIKIINNDDTANVSGISRVSLNMSSNIRGGVEISPIKLNSSNSDVYSGITVKKWNTSTLGNVLRKTGSDYILSSPATPHSYDLRHNGGSKASNGRMVSFFKSGDATPIILRNGESISFKSLQNTYSSALNVVIVISDVDGGGFGDVIYSFDTNITSNFDIFSISNTNGSGKAIKIVSIDVNYKLNVASINAGATETGSICSVFSVCQIVGTTENTGDVVVPTKLNSTNTLGDTDVEVKEFAKTQLINQSGIGSIMSSSIIRKSGKFQAVPNYNGFEKYQSVSSIKSNKFTPIILNEGDGIGIFPEVMSVAGGINDLIVEYTITEIPAPPSSGGETAYAYP